MKKVSIAVMIILIVSCIILACGWYLSAHSGKPQKAAAQGAAKDSYEAFLSYQETGEEKYYLYAVSSFYCFEQAYRKYDESEYPLTNTVYALLVEKSEQSKENLGILLEAMKILSEDVTHANGYLKLSQFKNAVGGE